MPRITLVLLVVLIFGALAAGARADTEEAALRGKIASAVARFLGVEEGQVAIETLSAASAAWEPAWSSMVRDPRNQAPRERGEACYWLEQFVYHACYSPQSSISDAASNADLALLVHFGLNTDLDILWRSASGSTSISLVPAGYGG